MNDNTQVFKVSPVMPDPAILPEAVARGIAKRMGLDGNDLVKFADGRRETVWREYRSTFLMVLDVLDELGYKIERKAKSNGADHGHGVE